MDHEGIITPRQERIYSGPGTMISGGYPMSTAHKDFVTIRYWRLSTTPRNYNCINIIGCVTFNGEYPNSDGRPIPGNWSEVKHFDRHKFTKLEEIGNAAIYGYM